MSYSSNMKDNKNTENSRKEDVQVLKLTGGVELVPLLTRRYLTTDATRPGYAINKYPFIIIKHLYLEIYIQKII